MVNPTFVFAMAGDDVPPYTTHTVYLKSYDSRDEATTPTVLQTAVATYAAGAPNSTNTLYCSTKNTTKCDVLPM